MKFILNHPVLTIVVIVILVLTAIVGWTRVSSPRTDEILMQAGTENGRYMEIAIDLDQILVDARITIPSPLTSLGSRENIEWLLMPENRERKLTIAQYDVAFNWNGRGRDNLRRIAVLHHEVLHMVISDQAIKDIFGQQTIVGEGRAPTLTLKDVMNQTRTNGNTFQISFGPTGSGSYTLGKTLLEDHLTDTESNGATVYQLMEPEDLDEMVKRFKDSEYDIICFVSDVPSNMLRMQLENPEVRLLSLDSTSLNHFLGERREELQIATIAADEGYRCQLEGDEEILTIGTHAVLLATVDFDPKVAKRLAEAILDPASAARLDLTPEQMVAPVAEGIRLHEGAKNHYRKAGILFEPASGWEKFVETTNPWLNAGWRVLAIFVILAAGCRWALVYRRETASDEIGIRILSVPVESGNPKSVGELVKIRGEIQERVQRSWWRNGEINREEWGTLHRLIGERIVDAQTNVSNAMVAEIQAASRDERLEKSEHLKKLRTLQWQILGHFSNGELDSSQHDTLLELIHGAQAEQNAAS